MLFRGKEVDPPEGIRTATYTVRPITTADNELDYAAVMESREYLRAWEQSTWPEDDFTAEANLEDMVEMVKRHDDRYAFGYTVMNPDETECLGCVYIFPPEAKMYNDATVTALGSDDWSDVDATVHFWVRKSRLEEGFDRTLLEALRVWIATDWPFDHAVFGTNEQFLQQVAMIEETDLQLEFEISKPAEPGTSRCYA